MRIQRTQALSVSTTDAAAAAVPPHCLKVRIAATAACFVALNRAATTSDFYVPANWPEHVPVAPNDVIHAVTASGTATLFITDLA